MRARATGLFLAAWAACGCSSSQPGPPTRAMAAAPAQAPVEVAEPVLADASTDEPSPMDASTEESAALGPGEHWTSSHRSVESCEDDFRLAAQPKVYRDPNGPKRKFGYDGYVWSQIELTRDIDGTTRRHCVQVLWPPGDTNGDGKKSLVSRTIRPSWFRLIERTMQRLPWRHLQAVERVVIDDRPVLHGVAPFDRGAPQEDARDGHTIWLDSHLFRDPNHWVHGNYGHYWGYHVQREGVALARQGAGHDLFSPVLLHEIGHIVNYSVVNGSAGDPTCPKCSEMCGDQKSCQGMKQEQREAFCATAYCTGFEHSSGTENWAEMYRWFYQGKASRDQLQSSFPGCHAALEGTAAQPGFNDGLEAPWERGLGEVDGYRKTRWDSCKGRACKAY